MLTSYADATYTEDYSVPCEDQSSIATVTQQKPSEVWDICFNQLLDAGRASQDREDEPYRKTISIAAEHLRKQKETRPTMPPIYLDREPSGGIIIEYEVANNVGDRFSFIFTFYNNGSQDFVCCRNDEVVYCQRYAAND